jgi:hypothetical protein
VPVEQRLPSDQQDLGQPNLGGLETDAVRADA